MKITSSAELVSKALKEIKTITTDEAHTKMTEGKSNIIDIRENIIFLNKHYYQSSLSDT